MTRTRPRHRNRACSGSAADCLWARRFSCGPTAEYYWRRLADTCCGCWRAALPVEGVKSIPIRHFASRIFAPRTVVWAGLLVAAGALAPLVPWTLRNLHTLHRFEPLAPRYATDSDDIAMNGFNRWVKTWMADYVSVQEIYWQVPGAEIDVTKLPRRAFDSDEQKERTSSLLADYNRDHDMTLELDARFAALAAERVHAAPLRYYVWLPAVRSADMWLRPRTELFPSDPRWWEFNDDARWLAVSLAFGADESSVRCYVDCRARALARKFWHRTICFICAVALRISGHAGKSRTSLHTGMLSRGHSAGIGALPAACMNFQIWYEICEMAYSIVSRNF